MSAFINFRCEHHYASGFSLNAAFETHDTVTALFGPSGSGKTTILSLIAGLLRPRQGTVLVGEDCLTDTYKGVFLRPEQRRVGMMFQDNCLFPHLRVSANIAYGWKHRPQDGISMRHIVETLELADLMHRFPRQLSGGQQQRVALARALASSPRLLLLDEPVTAVESPLQQQIIVLLQRVVHEFAVPILLVSHNRDLVDRLAGRIIIIANGIVTEEQ